MKSLLTDCNGREIRGHSGTPIICHVCGWKPRKNYHGGIRWKLLAKHYEKRHLNPHWKK